jgi:hypothetical protein
MKAMIHEPGAKQALTGPTEEVRMRSRLSVLVPALFFAAVPLAAQSGSGTSGSQSGTQSAADTTQRSGSAQARIDAVLSAAPPKSEILAQLKSKLAEGQANQVPPDRIATALEVRLASLVRASTTMQQAGIENRSAAELLIAGDAMQAGVKDSAVVQVYRNAAPGRRVVAMAVLTDLVRLGVSSDVAFDRVNATLGSSSALASLQAEVASQLRLGGLNSTLDAAGGIGGTLKIP